MTYKNLSPARYAVARLVLMPLFRNFITFLILLNAVILGLLTQETLSESNKAALMLADSAIVGVFVLELALKLFAYRGSFFRSGWNVFDFVVVGISVLPAAGPFAILRTLRVFRVLRLISVVPRMRRVVDALLSAIPGMASVMAVLLVVFYVGAVLTTDLFSAPALADDFGSISRSMYTLFQVMTLEDWIEVADSTVALYPWAWAFFIPFIILTSFAVLNLFIGIIVDAMNLVHEDDLAENQKNSHADYLAVEKELASLRQEIAALNASLSKALEAGPAQKIKTPLGEDQ